MTADRETVGWATVALVLMALAIPWFMWDSRTVVAGLPAWLWWHVGWMGVAAVVFAAFARFGWGVGVVTDGTDSADERRGEEVATDG